MSYFRTHPATHSIPLDPEIAAAIAAQPDRLFLLPVDAFRSATLQRFVDVPKINAPVSAVDDRDILGPGGRIPVRIYHPEGRGPFPVVIYYHGGGWVACTLDTHDDTCRTLCHRSESIVVSVDYRLAPESKYPAAVDDSYAALEWVAENAAMFGGDPRRIAVAGDSAGGNLAAAVALRSRDQGGPNLAIQVLIYPVTNYALDTASYHENADGFGLSRDAMIFFWESYLANADQGRESYASPLQAASLAGLPPTLILTAQFDPLRDDGEAYAARLHREGNSVRVTRYLDVNHGFFLCGELFESSNRALHEVADALKDVFRA